MNDYEFPTCPPFNQLPARLKVKTVGVLLAFSASDIPVLIAAGLLKPLGKPAPNAPKFFARVQIERLGQDLEWLNQATRCVSQHCIAKRGRRVNGAE